jgi:peptidoglycan lytic transglycosylase B
MTRIGMIWRIRRFLAVAVAVFAVLQILQSVSAQEAPNETDGDANSASQSFAQWVAELKAEALTRGISQATIDAAFANVSAPNPRVVELDRNQPEFVQTYEGYLSRRVTSARIERGLRLMGEHRETLRAVAEAYGVQPRFIAAIWGMETNFGSFLGGMNVIQSLATLAYDPRRAAFFRDQLFAALRIIEEGHVAAVEMVGSWGGAMGHSQFMPRSFFNFAQDFDGDGKRDIWGTEADVFASIAFYLKQSGWRNDMTWGRQVTLPENMAALEEAIAPTETVRGCRARRSHSASFSLQQWNDMGLRRLNGDNLPSRELQAALVRPAGQSGPAYLVYSNFRGILAYNCANYYALAVSQLADALKEGE